MATSGFGSFPRGVGSEQYFGGAPRFDSASTFLGKKVEALAQAGQVANEETARENFLGTSDRARYGNVLDSLKNSEIPVLSDMAPIDFRKTVDDLVKAQVSQLPQLPEGWASGEFLKVIDMMAAAPMPKVQAGGITYEMARQGLKGISIPLRSDTSQVGSAMVAIARAYLGVNRYKFGQFDCSAFTSEAARTLGLNIGRDTASQIAFFKKKKQFGDIKTARPGDILYFRSSASPSGRHTGVYVGKGMMIDNAGEGKPIKLRSIVGRILIGVGYLSKWGAQAAAPAPAPAPAPRRARA